MQDRKMYEQHENYENPLRCPVKLYEFYLSKVSNQLLAAMIAMCTWLREKVYSGIELYRHGGLGVSLAVFNLPIYLLSS